MPFRSSGLEDLEHRSADLELTRPNGRWAMHTLFGFLISVKCMKCEDCKRNSADDIL